MNDRRRGSILQANELKLKFYESSAASKIDEEDLLNLHKGFVDLNPHYEA